MPSKESWRRRRRRLKPNIPTALDGIEHSVSHRDELRRVLEMLDTIEDTTEDIVRTAEAAPRTLTRVSELSRRLPKDVLPFAGSGSILSSFNVSLETYALILIDVRDGSIANNCNANCDVINRRLDLFMHEFKEKLDRHAAGRNEPIFSESASILPNSRNVRIFGGIFNNHFHQPLTVPDQSHKIFRILYIQCAVLFA